MHKLSVGLDVIGFNAQLMYKRWPSLPTKYTLKVVRVDPDPAEEITKDYINEPSLNNIIELGVKAERSNKPLELTATAANDVTEIDIRKKIDAILKDGKNYQQQVFDKLPYQENKASMMGLGLSAGYHYHMPLVIYNVRAGLDYMWGTFNKSDLYPASSAQLGWGIKTGIGIDYKLTEKATFGFEGGLRLGTFKNSKASQICSESKWFIAPYLQGICGFNPHPDYNVSVFCGYFLPVSFPINTSGGNIPNGTTCKIQGMFGGIKISKYF